MCRRFRCLAICVLFAISGCGGSSSSDPDSAANDALDSATPDSADPDSVGPDSEDPDVVEARMGVSGTAFDIATSLPLAGVAVSAPGATPVTTDENGNFTMDDVPVGAGALLATRDGYAAAVQRMIITGGEDGAVALAVTFAMKAVGATATIDAAVGGTVSDASGAQVTFPANCFVTKDGQAVTGDVTVTITPINPYDPVEVQAFPGSFEAVSSEGVPGFLLSYSVMDITATAGGEELTLAEGKTAAVVFPLQMDVDAPSTIALWSLDEKTGLWNEEGTAARRMLEGKRYYEAEIQHLSYWNCDSFDGATVTIRGKIVSSNSTLNSSITSDIIWGAKGKSQNNVGTFSGTGYDTTFEAQMPANDFVALQIFGMTGVPRTGFTSSTVFLLTPASGTIELGNINVVPDTCAIQILYGLPAVIGLTSCNGSCITVPYFCIPGLDPKHPCATNNGGCLNSRQCVEAASTSANSPTTWSCGACPQGKTPLGLLDCQPLTCSISNGFCDDNATCANVTSGVTCSCNTGYFGDGHSCAAWTTCTAGKSVATQGTSTTDRTCAACASGTFSTVSNAASCTAWGSCGAGTYVSAQGTASSDRVCTTCASGTYSTTANAQSCSAWTNCSAGQHVATSGTASSDRTCEACDAGTYSKTTNATNCTAWTECAATQYESQAGSATKDRTCGECDPGYQGDGTSCVPSCLIMPCGLNASCTAPDTCTCDAGYSGDGYECAADTPTTMDISAGLVGNDAWNWASTDSVRGLEFYLGTQESLSSVIVSGLPPDKASTARIWIKTGAVNLQVTDTFPLGPPYSPTSTTSSTATFVLPTPKQIGFNTYSIVISVADTDVGYQWNLQQIYNNGPSVTVDSITVGSIWGWRGNVNVDTNTATDVVIYDNYMIQIPKVTLVFSN